MKTLFGRKWGQLSIKLLQILQKLYNMPNLEPLGFSFLYPVSEIT